MKLDKSKHWMHRSWSPWFRAAATVRICACWLSFDLCFQVQCSVLTLGHCLFVSCTMLFWCSVHFLCQLADLIDIFSSPSLDSDQFCVLPIFSLCAVFLRVGPAPVFSCLFPGVQDLASLVFLFSLYSLRFPTINILYVVFLPCQPFVLLINHSLFASSSWVFSVTFGSVHSQITSEVGETDPQHMLWAFTDRTRFVYKVNIWKQLCMLVKYIMHHWMNSD